MCIVKNLTISKLIKLVKELTRAGKAFTITIAYKEDTDNDAEYTEISK